MTELQVCMEFMTYIFERIISRGLSNFLTLILGLAHCRHLKTVRTHLSGLVNQVIVAANEPLDASGGLTVDIWEKMSKNGVVGAISFSHSFMILPRRED